MLGSGRVGCNEDWNGTGRHHRLWQEHVLNTLSAGGQSSRARGGALLALQPSECQAGRNRAGGREELRTEIGSTNRHRLLRP